MYNKYKGVEDLFISAYQGKTLEVLEPRVGRYTLIRISDIDQVSFLRIVALSIEMANLFQST